jgi:hypothetical protein
VMDMGGEAKGYKYKIDKAILYVLKDPNPIYITETPDFLEKLYQNNNLAVIHNTANDRYMLIEFKDENDAKRFKQLMSELADVFAKYFNIPGAPLILSYQRRFIKTLVSYFENAKIICYAKMLSERFQEVGKNS